MLVGRFGDAIETAIREQVAKALQEKGASFVHLKRYEDAIAAYDALVGRFGDATEAVIREQVAMALVNKGWCFDALERYEDGIATYDDCCFGASATPPRRPSASRSLRPCKKKEPLLYSWSATRMPSPPATCWSAVSATPPRRSSASGSPWGCTTRDCP